MNICKCGCNKPCNKTFVKGHNKVGYHTKNQPKGDKHHNWKGGRQKIYDYWYIHKPDHPYCNSDGNVLEHRLVMEEHLGRYLLPTEHIHHIIPVKQGGTNDIKNLTIVTNSQHMKITMTKDKSNRMCKRCGSNSTLIDKYGVQHWHNDKLGGWKCERCYHKEYYRNKKS